MILGIDAGNTNIVAALIDEQGVKELVREQALCGVMISSVVPEIDESLKQVCMPPEAGPGI